MPVALPTLSPRLNSPMLKLELSARDTATSSLHRLASACGAHHGCVVIRLGSVVGTARAPLSTFNAPPPRIPSNSAASAVAARALPRTRLLVTAHRAIAGAAESMPPKRELKSLNREGILPEGSRRAQSWDLPGRYALSSPDSDDMEGTPDLSPSHRPRTRGAAPGARPGLSMPRRARSMCHGCGAGPRSHACCRTL
jgi:hypothetical protein